MAISHKPPILLAENAPVFLLIYRKTPVNLAVFTTGGLELLKPDISLDTYVLHMFNTTVAD